MAKATRKCRVCGNEFNIVENDYVTFKNGYVEVGCFKEYKLKQGISEEVVDIQLSELLDISQKEKKERSDKDLEITRKKIDSKKRESGRTQNLDRLINYFTDTYGISNYPQFFYRKLAEINRGTFKGLKVGIPYNDLLDMFKIKQVNLNNIYARNIRIGKEIDGLGRINYDLAIIINKYDEYVKWKNKQNILASTAIQEVEKSKTEIKIDYSKIVSNARDDNSLDIGDLLDDIY